MEKLKKTLFSFPKHAREHITKYNFLHFNILLGTCFYRLFVLLLIRPSTMNDNEDNSSESGSEGSTSIDSSSDDDGSKNEPVKESITNWSLSTFVKPDPKPIEKEPSHSVPQVKMEVTGDSSNNVNTDESPIKRSFSSPKCLTNERIKQEPIGK